MRSCSALAPRVYVYTLGCPKNEADSRALLRSLVTAGACTVADPEDATHILLNTCGFIQAAKEESIGAILDACNNYGGKKVLVMGCLVERYGRELEEGIPEVAGWFGLVDPTSPDDVRGSSAASDRGTLTALLEALGAGGGSPWPEQAGVGARIAIPLGVGSPVAPYAYLKVSDGCDELCTFCAIPGIKGGYRSVPTDRIVAEADACLDEGARELVLVGQDTAVWECDGLGLAGLIDLLAADDRVRRVRVMYLQPEHVTDAFLRYMAGQPKLCRYLDVPFQHAHPEVLHRMGRRGGRVAFLDLLARARQLMPDVSVRSTFIVGFPGETEAQFEELLSFVDEAGFDHAGGFVYSPEEGTVAAGLRPRVRASVARDRLARLTSLLEARAESGHRRLVGSRIPVMIDTLDPEETGEGNTALGRTEGQAPEVDGVTHLEGDLPEGARPGDVVPVVVSAALGYDLVGTYDAS
jgi:ribosomal protein S12 methylthiotransferase